MIVDALGSHCDFKEEPMSCHQGKQAKIPMLHAKPDSTSNVQTQVAGKNRDLDPKHLARNFKFWEH